MPARKKEHIPRNGANSRHHAVCSRCHLPRHFSTRAPISEQFPVRALSQDVNRAAALILAVVPFDQVGINFGDASKARQFAGPPGTLQWAGEHLGEGESPKSFSESSGDLLAVFGQWQIGTPGMLSRKAPGRFTVTGNVDNGKLAAHSSYRL